MVCQKLPSVQSAFFPDYTIQAGTIIHESSHFNVNGGTRDHAYGQAAARALARSSPNTAVLNADSHEYFAENTPFLA